MSTEPKAKQQQVLSTVIFFKHIKVQISATSHQNHIVRKNEKGNQQQIQNNQLSLRSSKKYPKNPKAKSPFVISNRDYKPSISTSSHGLHKASVEVLSIERETEFIRNIKSPLA